MFKSVNHVLVGGKFTAATDIKSVLDGEFVLVDDKQNILDPTAPIAATVKEVMIGVVHGTQQIIDPATSTLVTVPNIMWGNAIRKGDMGTSIFNAFELPTKADSKIDSSALAIPAGESKNINVRILYKDVDPSCIQFTKTYNVYDVVSAVDFNTKLAAAINKDQKARVIAQMGPNGVDLIAKDIVIDNNIDEFSMVSMEVSVYEVPKVTGIFAAPKLVVDGISINTSEPKFGIGNFQLVLDMERKYRGYKGTVSLEAYPTVEGTQWANPAVQYDEVTINYESLYRSNDNQYVKTTPITYTLYVEAGDSAEDLATNIRSFITDIA